MIARVIVCREGVDKLFDYLLPEQQEVNVGDRCLVPFGVSNKEIEGYIAEIVQGSELEQLKQISSIDKSWTVDIIWLKMALFLRERYLCSYFGGLRLFLPPTGTPLYKRVCKVGETDDIKLTQTWEKVLEYIRLYPESTCTEVQRGVNCSASTLRTMQKKGLIEMERVRVDRSPKTESHGMKEQPKKLNREQMQAFRTISSCSGFACYLIHGVTASGKTEVYLQIISKTLQNGRKAIMLVPEIALTSQMVEVFEARFGDRAAVLHSRLSDGERLDQWHRIREGGVSVVIGVRSAIFAPIQNVGVIILDEEHEQAYVSENHVRYNAREVAMKLAKMHDAVCILASATPSISSYYAALSGKINLIELKNRVNQQCMPKAELVDMRKELKNGNRSCFSMKLQECIRENIRRGQQTILLLNRRGYTTFVCCRSCGFVASCDDCSIPLTFHKTSDRLHCHYCGEQRDNYQRCPTCGSRGIKHFGTGTQKIEEEIRTLFPNATYIRMDMDTTATKGAHKDILRRFRDEKIDILLGTQMISKGLDFDRVTLVGVMAADSSLYAQDFRADERTFDLIAQVLGRAGRGDIEGRALIQTYNPENKTLIFARNQDYRGFYDHEIKMRQMMVYPPFCNILNITLSGEDEKKVEQYATKLYRELRDMLMEAKSNVKLYAPKPAQVYKIKSRFRYHFWMKCRIKQELMDMVRVCIAKYRDITIIVESN